MAIELAEVAAGFPLAASFAIAGGITAFREGRRRTSLNEAVHELRRPLQAIALSAPASTRQARAFESSLRMAAAAVDRLDGEINGRSVAATTDAVSLRGLVESAVERWRARASLERRELSLKWEAGDACLVADVVELAQVLDNLISNGLDHGRGAVAIEAEQVERVIRVAIVNRTRAMPAGSRGRPEPLRAMVSGRRRHGHGLRVVRRAASRSGGSFRLRQSGDRCEAVLELPLRGGGR